MDWSRKWSSWNGYMCTRRCALIGRWERVHYRAYARHVDATWAFPQAMFCTLVNDSAIGLVLRHKEQDLQHIKDLVLLRMEQAYPKASLSNSAAATTDSAKETTNSTTKTQDDLIGVLNQRIASLERDMAQLEASLKQQPNLPKNNGWFSWIFGGST